MINTTISLALFPAVTVTVVRDRKIRTALRTNQIARFVTVPSWKKIYIVMQMRKVNREKGYLTNRFHVAVRLFSDRS